MGTHEIGLIILLFVLIGVFVPWVSKQINATMALIVAAIVVALFLIIGFPVH